MGDKVKHEVAKWEIPCSCAKCAPSIKGPLKFVFVDETPHSYSSKRKAAAVYMLGNIIIGCILMFWYYMFLYYTSGITRPRFSSSLKRHQHIYLCSIGVLFGLGGGIMAMSTSWATLGKFGRRVIHIIMSGGGMVMYTYGSYLVYAYNPLYYGNTLHDQRTIKAIVRDMDRHHFTGFLSIILCLLCSALGPLALVPFKPFKFFHLFFGSFAFVSSMLSVFTAMLDKDLVKFIDVWKMHHLYYDTLLIMVLLIIIVLMKPISKCYLCNYETA